MPARKIDERVWAVGAIDWNRRLFDELIPLPDGTSYNSYVVRGADKTALLDTVDPTMTAELFANLNDLGIKHLDYVIAHHAEQDHSGSLPAIIKAFPSAVIVCGVKAKQMLIDLLGLPEDRFKTMDDGETLSLGDCTLRFITTPWVHWPETVVSFLEEDGILFSCDFFGSHIASSDLMAQPRAGVAHAAKRYYAEIMMPFRKQIVRNLEKLSGLKIKMIAPSHGPVHDKPEMIVASYEKWTSDDVENTVVLPYVSMHGSTQLMVDRLIASLMTKGIKVEPYFLSRADIGDLAGSMVQAATIVIGTPTVLQGPHPLAIYAATLAAALKPKTRFISCIGSYGWGGKTVETLGGIVGGLGVEIIEPVLVKGYPKDNDLAKIDALADSIALKHAAL